MKKIFTALAAAAACALACAAAAQSYPARPAKILVGFAAGGPTDVIARIVAQDMTQSLGQSFVVENRPGANAIIATEAVARSAPDGYTLLFSSLSLLVNAILMEGKVHYDPFKDFAPVSNAAVLPMVVVTSPETRINSMQDLVALARAKPGELSYATSGNGGSTHLAGASMPTQGAVSSNPGKPDCSSVGTAGKSACGPGVPTARTFRRFAETWSAMPTMG